MDHTIEHSNENSRRMSNALLDGLVALTGLTIATGSFFHNEIVLWWLGA